MVLLPGGYLIAETVGFADRRLGPRWAMVAGALVGLLLVSLLRPTAQASWWFGIALVPLAALHIYRYERSHVLPVIEFLIILFFGFALVWNVSYLGTAWVGERAQDGALRYIDLQVYGAVLGVDKYEGLFPLVRNSTVIRMLQTGYILYYLEVFVVAFLLERVDDSFAFLVRFLAAHVIGALFFVVYPVFGPCVIFPSSIDPILHGTPAWSIMQLISSEYRAVLDGGALTGTGYFVGLPSLHTAGAVILQVSIRKHPLAFWLLLPFNICMVLATFVLGFHYLLDVAGGVLLAGLVWVLPFAFRAWRSQIVTDEPAPLRNLQP